MRIKKKKLKLRHWLFDGMALVAGNTQEEKED
jgi:hypothetical protein